MNSDVIAAVVVTVAALAAMYLWLVVCEAIDRVRSRRRWRNAAASAQRHYGFRCEQRQSQPVIRNHTKESTS